ncbi:hypothetical protein PAPHI01_0204 [Pancytospora philotis]|nr:hypothetical protein PAPHI01_0204 [Pancytospora philotis]
MIGKKEKLLQKYLDKKKQQARRDDLYKQLVEISGSEKQSSNIKLIKTKVRKAKAKPKGDTFEKRLFEDAESTSVTGSDDLCGNSADNSAPEDAGQEREETTAAVINGGEEIADDGLLQAALDRTAIRNEDEHTSDPNEPADALLLSEVFVVERCGSRLEAVQDQRKQLPIFYEEAEIVSRIKANLITFVQGDTGCGKTTQLPQFLLENGFRGKGLIGVTQPRRLAAVSIAERINCELNEGLCGYKIKYESSVCGSTRIKVVTEGVLFREIQADFLLSSYSVIILDEVHERTVTIDILIGLLSKIVKLRYAQGNPLRLVLMSATVDVEDFRGVLGDFHRISLAGKSHKVSVFYEERTEEDYLSAVQSKILGIVDYVGAGKKKRKAYGSMADVPVEVVNDEKASILVFLPSKEDIYTLKSRLDGLDRDLTVLPLHSALSKDEQARVYSAYANRKVVLATNIAETSITISDVVFVIDSGRAKFKIQDEHCVKYQVGFISKSSARQRMGRAGRTGPGVCFRIYSGPTYEAFNAKNVPQIQLEPIDGTLLQLKVSGVENFMAFPLVTPVGVETVADAVASLQRMGALDGSGIVTALGKEMSRYAIPPRYARLLCLPGTEPIFSHLAVIAAILTSGFSVARPRASDYFIGESSDLVAHLKIFYAYSQAPSKARFAAKHGLSIPVLQEIGKLSKHLVRISGRQAAADVCAISPEQARQVCRALYLIFCDHVAVNSGAVYIYKDGSLEIGRDSVDVSSQSIVFDHIACGRNKDYAKNITVINKDWFAKGR